VTNLFFRDAGGVANVGIDSFVDTIRSTGTPITAVDWKPYPDVDESLLAAMTDLGEHEVTRQRANERAASRIVEARPIWRDIQEAQAALELEGMTLCHAGPPVT
jgi:hypothetical protein